MSEKVKKPLWKRWWVWVVAVLIIGGIANAGSGDKQTTSTDTTQKQSADKAKDQKPAELSKEGVSSDVKIVVEGFESKAEVGDNQFTRKKAQGVFKIVRVTLTNNQKDAITIDSNGFKLVDDQGREFSYSSEAQLALESSVNQKQESFFLKKLNPGLSATGHVVFDVPQDAKGFVLKARGGFTGKEIKLKIE